MDFSAVSLLSFATISESFYDVDVLKKMEWVHVACKILPYSIRGRFLTVWITNLFLRTDVLICFL